MSRPLLDGCERIRADGWVLAGVRVASHTAEDKEIKEMHSAEDEQHHADFYRERLDALFGGFDGVAELEGQTDVAEVDEIEADDEQVIDGVGQGVIAMEDVNEKDAAIFVERTTYPDGQRDAEGEVNQVCGYSDCHG